MKLDEMLIDEAKRAMEHAYAPYSKFRVGAALMTEGGEIFHGANIENASYGATVCAERVALFKAVYDGKRKFDAIAIVSDGGEAPPCGICRQALSEFAGGRDMTVYTQKADGSINKRMLSQLLPEAFTLDADSQDISSR